MKKLIVILFLFNYCFAQVNFNVGPPDTNVVPLTITIGQSNTGRPLTTAMSSPQLASYGGVRTNTYIFNPWQSTDTFQLMNVGTNCRTEAADIRQFGPEASLFKLLENYKTRERYCVKMGIGGTSMQGVWRPYLNNFNLLMRYTDTAISEIIKRGKTPRVVGFIFMQGETDALTETNSGLYYTNMVKFWNTADSAISKMLSRRNLPEFLTYRKIVGRIKPNPQVTYAYATVVREAQERFCKNYNGFLIDTDAYIMLDDEHFSATGQIDFGTAIFNIVKDL